MRVHDTRIQPIRETWPLLALRYVLIAAGVFAWLWEAERTTGFVVGSVLFSLTLLLELAAHAGSGVSHRSVWAGLQVILGLGAIVAHPGVPATVVLTALLAGVASVTPLAFALVGAAVAAVVTVVVVDAPVSVFVGLVGAYALAVTVGHLFLLRSKEIGRHKEMVAQLEQAQARLAEFSETARDLAVAQERQHMAEELHDTLGHALVGTLLQLQVAKKLLKKDLANAEERLEAAEVNIRSTLEQVRHALRRGPRRRGQLPLHLALESLVADFAAAGGPEVELALRPDPESVSDVPTDVADVLYRTTQEALTNAVRHGRATRIQVEAEAVGPRLFLRITDNGIGADQYTPGMGLVGMVNRVQTVGGTLRFETAAGAGFTVEVGVKRR